MFSFLFLEQVQPRHTVYIGFMYMANREQGKGGEGRTFCQVLWADFFQSVDSEGLISMGRMTRGASVGWFLFGFCLGLFRFINRKTYSEFGRFRKYCGFLVSIYLSCFFLPSAWWFFFGRTFFLSCCCCCCCFHSDTRHCIATAPLSINQSINQSIN